MHDWLSHHRFSHKKPKGTPAKFNAARHTSHIVALFLSQPNAVNRDYLSITYGIELPGNNTVLTKKLKKTLGVVLEREGWLFENKAILNTDKLTAAQVLDSLKIPPPHPKLVMHILPPYSPNLNPIERLWKVMNELARNNQVFKTFNEFKEKIRTFFCYLGHNC